MKRVIVGEGSYGCVHRPGIHCTTPPKPNFKYSNYVSKIMTNKHAVKELDKFLIVNKIDPTDEYHLGEPILCQPNLNEPSIKKDIGRCKNIDIKDIEDDPDKYSLLLMKFGGPNLKVLCKKYMVDYLKVNKQERLDKFWIEIHHLLKGVKFFKENGLIHNDIKPQNILFNPNDGTMKFIDFGLMRTKKEILTLSESSKNDLAVYHWSYPFDCGFMNNNEFSKYKACSLGRKTFWKHQLSELIVTNSDINTLHLPISNPEGFSVLFTYINPDNTIPNADTQYGYIESFFDGFNEMIENTTYENTLDFIADSIDIFGLGITLQFIINCLNRHNVLELSDFMRLSSFCNKMYDFNPLTRVIDIDLLIKEFENILLEMGVLTRLGKTFENNLLVDGLAAPINIIKEAKEDSKTQSKQLSQSLQKLAEKDPVKYLSRRSDRRRNSDIKICPPEKELNPNTNRCNKNCKPGFLRNEKFRCRKNVTKKLLK